MTRFVYCIWCLYIIWILCTVLVLWCVCTLVWIRQSVRVCDTATYIQTKKMVIISLAKSHTCETQIIWDLVVDTAADSNAQTNFRVITNDNAHHNMLCFWIVEDGFCILQSRSFEWIRNCCCNQLVVFEDKIEIHSTTLVPMLSLTLYGCLESSLFIEWELVLNVKIRTMRDVYLLTSWHYQSKFEHRWDVFTLSTIGYILRGMKFESLSGSSHG